MIDEVAARNDHDRAAVADRVELEALGLPVTGRELEVARAIDRLSATVEAMRRDLAAWLEARR